MNTETVRSQFKTLKLHTAASEMEGVVVKHKTAVSFSWVSDLLEREIDARREKALLPRIKRANFPEITTLEGFGWSFNPDINEDNIRELATLSFILFEATRFAFFWVNREPVRPILPCL
jgi:DNA replication protein DnaC